MSRHVTIHNGQKCREEREHLNIEHGNDDLYRIISYMFRWEKAKLLVS
jgi:hypothetical protein